MIGMTSTRILQGDCRDLFQTLDDSGIDSIVTDPPYELGFMGEKWDATGVANDVEMWRQAFRVLKPGGHLLAFGGTRTYHRMVCAIEDAGFEIRDQIGWAFGSGFPKSKNLDGDWDGWGTALKPAWEPIVVARKPLIGTVAANVSAHGTGALNIDGCRVPGGDIGRWPANIIHDGSEDVLAAFPQAPGQMARARTDGETQGNNVFASLNHVTTWPEPRGDIGSAARFFYCAKASRRDRNEGLEGMQLRMGGMVSNTSGQHITRRDGGVPGLVANHHPTVKPTELMRYLLRLVTPPGGTTCDPFTGSGSTAKASVYEGFNFIGFELDQDEKGESLGYIKIAEARVAYARREVAEAARVVAEAEPRNLTLFDEEVGSA